MKFIKHVSSLFLMTLLFQCISAPKLQKEAPETLGEAYFQRWNAGIEGGGSGVNVHIKMTNSLIALDSVYFQGKAAKLQRNPNIKEHYTGYFKFNQSSEDAEKSQTGIPFELRADECVVSYAKDYSVLYFKISQLEEKEVLSYPSSPPKE